MYATPVFPGDMERRAPSFVVPHRDAALTAAFLPPQEEEGLWKRMWRLHIPFLTKPTDETTLYQTLEEKKKEPTQCLLPPTTTSSYQ